MAVSTGRVVKGETELPVELPVVGQSVSGFNVGQAVSDGIVVHSAQGAQLCVVDVVVILGLGEAGIVSEGAPVVISLEDDVVHEHGSQVGATGEDGDVVLVVEVVIVVSIVGSSTTRTTVRVRDGLST